MARHNELGRNGEQLAVAYLARNAFTILHTNWKYSWYEIDVIAHRSGVLHFVEVKTRSGSSFGFPEEGVDKKKMQKLMKAGEQYLYLHPSWTRVQYDILAVFHPSYQPPAFFLIEDVYLY